MHDLTWMGRIVEGALKVAPRKTRHQTKPNPKRSRPDPDEIRSDVAQDERPTASRATSSGRKMELDLSKLHEISGFLGACVVDCQSGATLSSIAFGDDVDMDAAGVANSDLVKAMHREMLTLGVDDEIEDILISLGAQYHLIRPITKAPDVFVYVAVDRATANLAMARSKVRDVESMLRIT